jgi:hypothetical protein
LEENKEWSKMHLNSSKFFSRRWYKSKAADMDDDGDVDLVTPTRDGNKTQLGSKIWMASRNIWHRDFG